MLGQTLANIRTRLKAELGMSLSIGVADDPIINQLLINKQAWFAASHDWAELLDRWDVAISIGTGGRYPSLPTTDVYGTTNTAINFDRGVLLEVKYQDIYQDVRYGIGGAEMNLYNSDDGDTANPVARWQLHASNRAKFEIWPLADDVQVVRFTAQRRVVPVVDDSSVFDLDDLLLVYSVAADFLASKAAKDAPLKAAMANARFNQIRSANQSRRHCFSLVSDDDSNERIVRVGIATGSVSSGGGGAPLTGAIYGENGPVLGE